MKLSSAKPISSPSRADKFPTPLMMRFLRSNVGSRSRGRSRSSPMFIMRPKKNTAAAINDAQQEPSSPKVTCIGQVRARRSSKSKTTSRPRKRLPPSPSSCCSGPCSSPCRCCCSGCCPPTALPPCCHLKTTRFRKPRSFCRPFRKLVLFFRFGYCKKIDVRDDCSSSRVVVSTAQRGQNHVNSANSNGGAGDIEDKEANGGETKEDVLESSTTSPPKNALLLTRCRSAPYRSSSLASRFWGSPLGASDNTETDRSPKNKLPQMPNSPNNYGDEAVESRSSSCPGESGSEELGSSSNGGGSNEATTNTQEMGGSIHPVLLTRCKSEPARTGERLDPEVINHWQQRRSYATESRLQQSRSNCD
ncbi:unnamed protein product [Coffea canephora]|uniref:Uncharacterized protein n=1 Tax=Coffea canephora TaxID=49390 RepID=A0A068UEQ0_COFCA|nr:unnamed protein product [Coffea canephora]